MANETLIGCFDASSKEVIFTQGSCTYAGCWENTTNSIDFTRLNDNCDDTYSACWNNTEKRFEASIPDNCCIPGGCGADCGASACTDNTPLIMAVSFVGLTSCSCINFYRLGATNHSTDIALAVAFNNHSFYLRQDSTNKCFYQTIIEDDSISGDQWANCFCDGSPPWGMILANIRVDLSISDLGVRVNALCRVEGIGGRSDNFAQVFQMDSNVSGAGCIVADALNNELTDCIEVCTAASHIYCKGGTANVSPVDAPEWSIGVTYLVGDLVYWEGAFYKCVLEHINQEPPNATYWLNVGC
jgi:hypothetical protein